MCKACVHVVHLTRLTRGVGHFNQILYVICSSCTEVARHSNLDRATSIRATVAGAIWPNDKMDADARQTATQPEQR
jgi:hypothetical protein